MPRATPPPPGQEPLQRPHRSPHAERARAPLHAPRPAYAAASKTTRTPARNRTKRGSPHSSGRSRPGSLLGGPRPAEPPPLAAPKRDPPKPPTGGGLAGAGGT